MLHILSSQKNPKVTLIQYWIVDLLLEIFDSVVKVYDTRFRLEMWT